MSILIITTIFMILFLIIGIYAGKEANTKEEYHLAGRKLKGWQVGLSAGATANSGFIVVGAVGMGYKMGIISLLYPLGWFLGDLIFWFLLAPKIRDDHIVKQSFTVAEVLSLKDKFLPLKYLVALIVIIFLSVYAASQLIASYKAIYPFFNLPENEIILLSFLVVILYVIWGGFKSSVYTDILQAVIMIILVSGLLLWGFIHVGYDSKSIIEVNPEQYSLKNSILIIIGFLFMALGFNLSQPQVLTRVFASMDTREIQKAKWIYILFLQFTWAGMTLFGILAKNLLPGLKDPEMAVAEISKHYFPDVIIGFILVGIIATILSSVDSMIVSTSSSLVVDFELERRLKGISPKKLYILSTLFVGLIVLIFALFLKSTVFFLVIFAISMMAASIGSAMLIYSLGISKNPKILVIVVIYGLLLSIIWRTTGLTNTISEVPVAIISSLILAFLLKKVFR